MAVRQEPAALHRPRELGNTVEQLIGQAIGHQVGTFSIAGQQKIENRRFASSLCQLKKGIDMQTGSISSSHTSNLFRNSSAATKDRTATPSATLPGSTVTTSAQVSISQEALAAASKAEQSGGPHNFDFTHMSQNELQVAAKKLFEDGGIPESDMLVFQRFGRVVGKAGPKGEFVELTPTERASADSAPKNFAAMLKEQLEIKRASPEALAFYKRMDAALSKVSAAHD